MSGNKQRTSFHKDCVNLFHGDEGEDIAEAIKTTYEKYQMNVSLFNISLENVETLNKCAQVIFLTPEVHSKILEGKLSHLLSKFEDSTHLILFHHHSIDVENEATRKDLENKLPKKNWRFVPLGKDNYEFKGALLDILKIIDTPEIFPVLKQFTLVPSSIWNPEDEVFIILRRKAHLEELEIRVSDCGLKRKIEQVRQINPTTFVFKPSGVSCGQKKVEVTLGGHAAGRSNLEIKPKLEMLHQIMNDVFNPIELLCQTLNMDCSTRESLDMEMSDIFSNGGTNPLSAFVDANFDYAADIQTNSEMPTLLHFGARYGLEIFCTTLLAFPGGKAALRIKNKDGKTPYKLAIYSGYTSLANNTLLEDEAPPFGEDHYISMTTLKRTGDRMVRPGLPPRSVSLGSADIPEGNNGIIILHYKAEKQQTKVKGYKWMESPYANATMRTKQMRTTSLEQSTFSKDSGSYSDDYLPLGTMSSRMSLLWNDEEVTLPQSTNL